MPVVSVNQSYIIENLTLDADSQGPYITLRSRSSESYLFCFNPDKPISKEVLERDLSENELKQLFSGDELQKNGYRLQGVRRSVLTASHYFRGFKASPPETIQVWGMSRVPFEDKINVYIPDSENEQVCYMPMRYKVTITNVPPLATLKVELLDHVDHGKYQAGALLYKVNDSLPLPITEDMLGKTYQIPISSVDNLSVIPKEGYEGAFKAVK